MNRRSVLVRIGLAAGAALAAVGIAAAQPVVPAATAGPAGNAFYVPPSPFPAGKPGHVIWSRPLTGGAVIPNAAENTLVLYQTTSVGEQDTAVSGTIAIPKGAPPAGGWPVLSWAHGTTGNGPECAPSRATGSDSDHYFDAWIARGFAVVQTDYEGQGTPGLHPYFVGTAAARDTIDIVRAARELYPQIGTKWFVFGHSEGGSAAIFTAALAEDWAPELHLMGAVSFAPASFIGSSLVGLQKNTSPSPFLPLMLEMIEGIASADRTINLRDLLTPEAFAKLPELQRRCLDDLMDDQAYISLPFSDIFRPDADMRPLLRDFALNEDNRLHVDVPLLIVQGDKDTLVPVEETTELSHELCGNGSKVTFLKAAGSDHLTVVTRTFDRTAAWVDAVAAGTPPPSTCT